MNLPHTEVISRLCNLQALVCEEHLGYTYAADCFCGENGFWKAQGYNPARDYRNDGKALEFIEQAVKEKLESLKAASRYDFDTKILQLLPSLPAGKTKWVYLGRFLTSSTPIERDRHVVYFSKLAFKDENITDGKFFRAICLSTEFPHFEAI